jgi:O-antigen/teichoic acid export membrane protein
MSFYAYISIIEVILKLAVVFLLQQGGFDKLIFYSILLFIVSILILFAYKVYCNKKFTISKYYFFWDGSLYKNIMSFSGWSLMGSVASISANQGINILLNIFFGVAVNAAMGIANQVNGALNSFVVNFQTAFKPQIVKSYAEGDKNYLTQLILQTSKFSFFLLFIVSIPILLNTEFVLKIWLKQVPEYAVEFCQLIIIYSLMEAISGPLWMSVQATGNIRNYQIIISLLFILNLPVSFIFIKLGFNPPVVMLIKIIVDAIVLTTRVLFLKSLLKVPIKLFLQEVFLKLILLVLIVIPIPLFVKTKFDGWNQVIITTSISILITALGIYWIGMKKNERIFVMSAISKYSGYAKIR